MHTNINLPIVLSFESEDHVKDFIEAAQEIIPKIKYEHIGGEGYNCVIYTRKDKAYRTIMDAATAPTTIVETPVEPYALGGIAETPMTAYVMDAYLDTKKGTVTFDMPPPGKGTDKLYVSWPSAEEAEASVTEQSSHPNDDDGGSPATHITKNDVK